VDSDCERFARTMQIKVRHKSACLLKRRRGEEDSFVTSSVVKMIWQRLVPFTLLLAAIVAQPITFPGKSSFECADMGMVLYG